MLLIQDHGLSVCVVMFPVWNLLSCNNSQHTFSYLLRKQLSQPLGPYWFGCNCIHDVAEDWKSFTSSFESLHSC